MSPRRLGENALLWSYRFLVLRDGEHCQLCGQIPATRNNGYSGAEKLERDHIDGDPWNENPDNLRLLCKKCNLAERNRAACAPRGDSPQKEREKKEGLPTTRIARLAVDYSSPSAPIPCQANFLFEVDVRKWILQKVADNGFYSKLDAIAAAAEIVGCSPQAVRSYLTKLTSSAGPLQERKDMLGGWMLEFKESSRQKALFSTESRQVGSLPQPVALPKSVRMI
jgi:hypothetical protein